MRIVAKGVKITGYVLMVIFLFSGFTHAISMNVTSLEPDKWYEIKTPASSIDIKNAPAMLKSAAAGYPYVSLYRYTLKPGHKYTFQSEYGADHLQGSACIRGINPLAPNNTYSSPSGTASLILCNHRSFPGGNIKGHRWGRYSNFIVSSKSKHNYAWLIFYSSKPNVPMKVKMHSKAKPDDWVRKKGGYTKRPGFPVRYSWSNVHKNHLYLGYVKGEAPFVPETSASQPPPPTVSQPPTNGAMGLNGQWELLDKNGKPYVWMDLVQTGDGVKGRAKYKIGSAALSGTFEGQGLRLKIIYDNPKVLENWLNKKVSKQVVGISSLLDLSWVPKEGVFKGTFHGFWINWHGDYIVDEKYNGGTENAGKKNPPRSRVLRRATSAPSGKPTLKLANNQYRPGEKIQVEFSAPSEYSSSAWIGIIPSSIPHGSETENDKHDLAYQYLKKRKSGQFTFSAPSKPGSYDFRMHDTDQTGKEVASVTFHVEGKKTQQPSVSQKTEPPGNLTAWMQYIKSGKPFIVVFDQTAGKFDDSTYTGDWKTDPMGTLKGGESYGVIYKDGKFTCTGYNQGKGTIISASYGGVRLEDALISLWGRTFAFDGQGRVWDAEYGIAGHLVAESTDTAKVVPAPVKKTKFKDDKGNRIDIPCGDKAFADKLISFKMGNPKPVRTASDPDEILGPNDYNEAKDKGFVSLGCGGSIVAAFSRVQLVDVPGPDLYVFEIGPSMEPIQVDISKDGFDWIRVGRAGGKTGAVDIGSHVQPGDRFRYVRLTDLKSSCKNTKWPGADIDAVAAIGCVETGKGPETYDSGQAIPSTPGEVVVKKEIPSSGGSLRVDDPGSPLNRFSIEVLPGSYSGSRTFGISHATVPKGNFGLHVNPVTPLITVENGGDYAETIMVVRIPVKQRPGYFAMPFYLDPSTGRLEGMPVIARGADHLVAVTRHFSSFFVSEIATSILDGLSRVETGFTPGRDNWGYINRGSYSSPRGICSGMAMTAMWYYIERFSKDGIGLQQRFDNLPRTFSTPGLEFDDATGIRWASATQKGQASFSQRAGISVLNEYAKLEQKKFDQGVWYGFAYAMLVTREPQYISIWGINSQTNEWYGHAIAAYGMDMEKGFLSVYDPNFDISSGRKIYFDKGASRFREYRSALNAKQLQQGQGLPFDHFYYFGKSAIVNWKKMGNRWKEVIAGTVGKTLFPSYHWAVVDQEGKTLARLDKPYTTFQDALRIKLIQDGPTGVAYYNKDWWRVVSLGSGSNRPKTELKRMTIKPEEGFTTIPLEAGPNRIGVRVVSKVDQSYEWSGFDWFAVTRANLILRPAAVAGVVDVPVAFRIESSQFPNRYAVTWDWGDDNRMETGSRRSAAHSWAGPGKYTVTVKVKDLDTGELFASAEAKVSIEALEQPKLEKETPADGCPEDLRKWCKERNYQGIRCLKCKAHDKSISDCGDCDFPRTYTGEGSWTGLFTSPIGKKKSSQCATATPVRVVLNRDGKATVWLDKWLCVDRKQDLSPVCEVCPKSMPYMIEGGHDGKGRVWFKNSDRNLDLRGRFDANSLSASGGGRFVWDLEEDLAQDGISFTLSKNK